MTGGIGRLTPAIQDELLPLIVQRLRSIAEPTRIRTLLLLEQHPMTVQEIADELDLSHQSASIHLNILHDADVLSRTKKGR